MVLRVSKLASHHPGEILVAHTTGGRCDGCTSVQGNEMVSSAGKTLLKFFPQWDVVCHPRSIVIGDGFVVNAARRPLVGLLGSW